MVANIKAYIALPERALILLLSVAKVFPYEVKNSKVVGSSPGEALDSGTGSSDISAQTENANYNSAQKLQAPKKKVTCAEIGELPGGHCKNSAQIENRTIISAQIDRHPNLC